MAHPCAIGWKRLSPERGLSQMQRFPIPSTEFTQVGYQEDSETLEIQFVKGGVYQFFNVPSSVFDEFMSAPSREGYYHSKIGERFPCTRIS